MKAVFHRLCDIDRVLITGGGEYIDLLKDTLPIMKLHKIDLFSLIMTEFELPDHFW